MYTSTSSRWCPTPQQLMILEDMYRGGIRTPKAAQIQAITDHLSHYGKIEGKNVFYWFQNHKARDRQKLRRKLMMSKQVVVQHNPNQKMPRHHQLLQNHESPSPPHTSQLFYYMPVEILTQGGNYVNASTPQMMSYPAEEKSLPRKDDADWLVLLDVGPTSKPVKTLELFPTTPTGHDLKNEGASSSENASSTSTMTPN